MKPASSESLWVSKNLLGVAAGALMLVLPFLGPWWIARVGTGVVEIALSPFDMSTSVLGQPLTFDLIWLFLAFEKITMLIAGAFMILASIYPTSWWSKRLFRFGMMKPFWAIVGLIVLVVAGAFLMNTFLPSLIANMTGTGGTSAADINIPYLLGTASSTIEISDFALITAPISLSLTLAFWVAVVTAALAIAARINHRKFLRQAG